jgi:hypothetical protein
MKLEDLESRKATFSKLYDQIKSGDFTVVWNAALTRNGNENDKLVIAYEKKAADQGGVVLFGGGSVRQATAAEFKAETIATTATAGTLATTPSSEYSAWKETVSKEGGFVISTPAAPGDPKASTKRVPTPKGNIVVYSLSLELPGKTVLQAAVTTYPQTAIKGLTDDTRLEAARDNLVASMQGNLIQDDKITLDKSPGRAFRIESANAAAQVRTYVVSNRSYMVMVMGPKGGLSPKDMEKFLASFKLISK